jgi:hypothetical protein
LAGAVAYYAPIYRSALILTVIGLPRYRSSELLDTLGRHLNG